MEHILKTKSLMHIMATWRKWYHNSSLNCKVQVSSQRILHLYCLSASGKLSCLYPPDTRTSGWLLPFIKTHQQRFHVHYKLHDKTEHKSYPRQLDRHGHVYLDFACVARAGRKMVSCGKFIAGKRSAAVRCLDVNTYVQALFLCTYVSLTTTRLWCRQLHVLYGGVVHVLACLKTHLDASQIDKHPRLMACGSDIILTGGYEFTARFSFLLDQMGV